MPALLYFYVGSLPYVEKPGQSLGKDADSSADAVPGQVKLPAWGTSSARENHSERWRLPPAHLQRPEPPEFVSLSSKKRTKPSLENSTGLRKHLLWHGGAVPPESATKGTPPASFGFNHANSKRADRRLAEAANSVSARFHHAASSDQKVTSFAEALPFPDSEAAEPDDPNALDHFNRPGKIIPYEHPDPFKGITRPSWVTNRQTSSLPYRLTAPKKGKGIDCSGKGRGELQRLGAAVKHPPRARCGPSAVRLLQMPTRSRRVWPSAGRRETKRRPTARASSVSRVPHGPRRPGRGCLCPPATDTSLLLFRYCFPEYVK